MLSCRALFALAGPARVLEPSKEEGTASRSRPAADPVTSVIMPFPLTSESNAPTGVMDLPSRLGLIVLLIGLEMEVAWPVV